MLLAPSSAAGPRIRLDDIEFDPLAGLPPVSPELHVGEAALEADDPLPFLIQFHGIPPDSVRADILALGIRALAYLPEDAWLVAARPSTIAAAGRPPLRWAGPLQPAWKLSARLRAILRDPPAAIEVHVLAHAAERIVSPGFHEIVRSPVGTLWKARGRLDPARAADLARRPEVLWIEPVPRYRLQGERASLVASGTAAGASACPDAPGYREWLARKGVSGEGITVHLVDDGLEQGDASNLPGTAHPDLLGRIAGIDNATRDPNGASNGGHGSLNAGIIAGSAATGRTDGAGFLLGLGVAPRARIFATKIFTDTGAMEIGGRTFTDVVARAARAGATLSSNSWGTELFGEYDADSMEFDALARDADPETPGLQPMAFFFPTGNEGGSHPGHPERTATSPATAKNAIAVGAAEGCDATGMDRCGIAAFRADSARDMAPFSGRGPARDGRLLPTLIAPGTHIAGPASTSRQYTGLSICDPHWPDGEPLYARGSGTSHACPVAAGAAALLAESYGRRFGRAPSPALLRALLVLGAEDCAGGEDGFGGRLGNAPDVHQGWGRVRLEEILPDAGAEPKVFPLDEARILREPGEIFELRISVIEPGRPVRVALAWTDPPAFPGARPTLVNDLDLEVEADGLFLGNAFAGGASVAGGEPDRLHNLECVRLHSAPASLVIRVRAHRLAGDGVPGDADPTDQDFALAILNGTDRSSRGTVLFDRPVYPCAGAARILASDLDLRGAGSVRVAVETSAGPARDVELREMPPASGLFEGEIALGAAAEPDALAVAHGDRIAVRYEDADAGDGSPATAEDEASIDCEPPVIAHLRFGGIGEDAVEIAWRTNEPATSEVLACPSGEVLASSSALRTEHRAVVRGFGPAAEVRIAVASADAAGNRSIEDRGGSCLRGRTAAFQRTFEDRLDPQPGAGWTHGATKDADGWLPLSWQHAASSPKVWYSPAGPGAREAFLVTPPLAILPGQIFEFRQSLELADGLDGAVVEISADGGATWEDLGPAIIEGGYGGAIDRRAETSLAGRLAWTGGRRGPMGRVRIAVGFWAGAGRRMRFRIASHPGSAAWGWAIDDVRLGSLVGPRGEIALARSHVPCAGEAAVAVADADLAGTGEVAIEASGSASRAQIRLFESPIGSGIFASSIPLGPAGIALAEGEELRATYLDPDDGSGEPRATEATARADCTPPRIEGIAIDESADGALRIRWRTDERATAAVEYGSSCAAPEAIASAPDRSIEHEVVARGVRPGETVRIRVASEDEAGNVGRDDALGACHAWRALVRAPILFHDAEGGIPPGWRHGAGIGRDPWRIVETASSSSPPHAWFAADPAETSDAWLLVPPIAIGPNDRLVFRHTYELEEGYDGAVIEISVDGGASWQDLGAAILEGGYSGRLRAGPLAGRRAWTGGTAGGLRRVIADLAAYAGAVAHIRFRISCDAEGAGKGWWIDDIAIESPLGGRGEVRLDRTAYRCEDEVRIELRDPGLAGEASATIQIDVDGAPIGSLGLRPTETPGVFRGELRIPPAGAPSVRDGSFLRIAYRDPDAGGGEPAWIEATRPIDCRAPRIGEARIEILSAWSAAFACTTDEPSRVEVRIGERCAAPQIVERGADPDTVHRIVLRGLSPGTTYGWRLAAEDLAGNLAVGGCMWSSLPVLDRGSIADPDGGTGGWTAETDGEAGWEIVSFGAAHSPTRAWFAKDGNFRKDASLVSPPLDSAAGDALSFWHAYELEMGFDGGVAEISSDGGLSWEDLGPAIVEGGYDAAIVGDGPLAGRMGWSGGPLAAMRRVWIDLGEYAGPARRIRLRIGCDDAVPAIGWYVDDIEIWHRGGEAPAAPRHLTATAFRDDVILRWENAGAYTSIRIYRDGERIAEIDGARLSHVDRGSAARDPLFEVAGVWWLAEARSGAACIGCIPFRRADANDSGELEIGDAISILNALFLGSPLRCADAADADDGGRLDIADAIYLLNYLFAGGPEPAPPLGACGADPTRDDPLGCDGSSCPR